MSELSDSGDCVHADTSASWQDLCIEHSIFPAEAILPQNALQVSQMELVEPGDLHGVD